MRQGLRCNYSFSASVGIYLLLLRSSKYVSMYIHIHMYAVYASSTWISLERRVITSARMLSWIVDVCMDFLLLANNRAQLRQWQMCVLWVPRASFTRNYHIPSVWTILDCSFFCTLMVMGSLWGDDSRRLVESCMRSKCCHAICIIIHTYVARVSRANVMNLRIL